MADNDNQNYEEVTVRVSTDLDPGLRDSLIRQLGPRVPTTVGNYADLQRWGAAEVAASGESEVVRLNPATDEDTAKQGAERALEEEAEARDAGARVAEERIQSDGEEPLAEKDPAVIKDAQEREASLKAAIKTQKK
jgi:hypothetical protein